MDAHAPALNQWVTDVVRRGVSMLRQDPTQSLPLDCGDNVGASPNGGRLAAQ